MKTTDKKYLKALGAQIRAIREKQDISQDQLAYECEISRVHVGRIEGGKQNTTVTTLLAIANALNVSLSELLDFE